ncbi:hypothetical protein CISIN_1g044190mg [Citrus sinensis]|uniref:Uncharacterized protein n=1 Tax=Citrus sinensis TaxID=2711 RepID=A0A067DYN6_CITSI|nr:hypothetical protein CISIN_1g044190mg [Citrus sinensis]
MDEEFEFGDKAPPSSIAIINNEKFWWDEIVL